MRKIYNIFFTLFFAVIFSVTGFAQNNFFTDMGENRTMQTTGTRMIIPDRYRTSALNVAAMKTFLWSLPSEQNLGNRNQAPVLSLPMPDGSTGRFRVWESSIQEPGLQAKFPEIRTFLGQGIDDPYASIRFDYNPYFGFSAQILSPNGRIYIDPFARWDVNNYISYYQSDNHRRSPFRCSVEDMPIEGAREFAGPCLGTQLRTYRLAIACTAEYSAAVGGSSPGPTHAAIVTSANRITGVYEVELAIRMVLINNNNLIEYTANPDPYSNVISTGELNTNQTNIDAVIGPANYDIGHLFTSDDNGVAQLGAVCGSGKARGATGSPSLIGDGFDIDYVAHEMGHQFGANHSFNSNTCASAGGSYEPGGGTTIMAYAGICAPNENVQPNSDPVFHAISFDQISTYINSGAGAGCPVTTPTGNTLPVITGMSNNNVSIPINTPFTLTGTATDADGDAITYNWEGWDVGAAGTWTSAATSTTRPLFRTRLSKTSGSRTFPDPRVIAANYPGTSAPSQMDGLRGEVLPQVPRTMKFRLTVRDNRAGGGGVVSSGDGCQGSTIFQVNAVGLAPFAITSPNGGESYAGGSTQTVTWNVSGTDIAPISVSQVKISISTDGGITFPTVLLASTANDGSETVTMPSVTSTTVRIKVEAIGNIFFDISNANFTLTTPVSGFDFNTPAAASITCAGPTTASITLGTTSNGGFSDAITLSASGNPAGTTVSFSPNPVTPGNSTTVTLNGTNTLANGSYVITVTGTTSGPNPVVTRTRNLTFTIQTGAGPSISAQPQPQAVCVGSTANFSVTAGGALSYQWQLSTDGGANFNNITSATNSSYTTAAVTTTMNNYQYRVIITGQCNTTTSSAGTLTVRTAPSISNQPANVTLCVGATATFNVTAAGTNITYLWQQSTDGGTNYSAAPGTNSNSSYTTPTLTAPMNNYRYRVVVSGTCTPAATSTAAVLTVISPVVVSTQPAPQTICETGNVTFTTAGTSTQTVIYQWQVSTDGGTNYTNIPGATNATLDVNAVTAGMNNNRYRALLSSATCATPTVTNAAALTVNARPTVTLAAAPYTSLLPGQTTTITATINPSAAGFNITWYKDNTVIPGITGTSYLVDSAEVGDYQVKIVNQITGCNNESQVLKIEAGVSERLFVYPSPNDGRFTVSYYNPTGESTQRTVVIHDADGKQVYMRKFPISGPYTLLNIDLRGSAKGLYIISVGNNTGKKLAKGKVMIQ